MSNNDLILDGASILVTGATGTVGGSVIKALIQNPHVSKIIIFSRDEFKQHAFREELPEDTRLRWFLGDVRDLDRLKLAMHGVTHVIHAAALKQVDAGEYNPTEFIKTNVQGSLNVIDAAIFAGIRNVLAISTDKASSPSSLYGATKLTADKLFISANAYGQPRGTIFSVVRFGNIAGSRGSIVPTIYKLTSTGAPIPITDPEMTRFWMKKEDAANFILDSFRFMCGGELFVPRIPSLKLGTLIQGLAPNSKLVSVGLRPGEKMHEQMISEEESIRTLFAEGRFIVIPDGWEYDRNHLNVTQSPLGLGEAYRSETNDYWIHPSEVAEFFGLEIGEGDKK